MPDEKTVPTLPGRYYTDEDIFVKEQQRIFGEEWVYVARADDLSDPGDVIRRQVGGENIIVVRGRDGRLRAFLNVCRHRGALLCLEESTNVGQRLRCPYHGWVYNLDGRLAGAPNWGPLGTDERQEYGLGSVALTEWGGLVWVNLSDDPAPLNDQLEPQLAYRFGGDQARIDRYGLSRLVVGHSRDYEVGANWKIIYENFQECYHCSSIHPELVEQIPLFGSLRALEELNGYGSVGYEFAAHRPSFSLSGASSLPAITGLGPEDTTKYFGMILRTNCFVSLLPDHVIVHRFTPVSPSVTRVHCDWLFEKGSVNSEGFDPTDTAEIFHRVNEQDFAASEWCQANMSSRSYRDGGVLTPLESEVIGRWFYSWYRSCMGLAPS